MPIKSGEEKMILQMLAGGAEGIGVRAITMISIMQEIETLRSVIRDCARLADPNSVVAQVAARFPVDDMPSLPATPGTTLDAFAVARQKHTGALRHV